MGFFDKMKNFVTGGAADVTVEAIEPNLGGPFLVKIHAAVEDTDIPIKKVYLKVVSLETVVVKEVEMARIIDEKMETVREDIEKTTTVHDQKIEVAGEQTLKANEEYDWETTVTLPDNALPSFIGITAKHEWKILAGLDASGNDPDSGWVLIHLI
ncbi:MAG: hypothetical protein U9N73_12270 [Candidatus Auribacterota bacterium]|nr:hypothetical protein [Candidatus Auribacterota bacterium]